jgi:hypothetical protein
VNKTSSGAEKLIYQPCGSANIWRQSRPRAGGFGFQAPQSQIMKERGQPSPRVSAALQRRSRGQGYPRSLREARLSALPASLVLAISLCLTGRVAAQNALRLSLAGEEATRARHEAASTIGYYNLKLGPSGWRFGAGTDAEYNDNVRLQSSGESDFILRPQINVAMHWPLTDKNALNLAAGIGYSAYLQHSELDRIYVTPNSELSFDLYVGDFWINFHDRFSITEDAYQDPTVTGNGDYSRLENDAGVSALWDLNKVILRLGYDHLDYVVLSGGAGQPDAVSDLFSTSAGYTLAPGVLAGLEVGGGFIHYNSTNAPARTGTNAVSSAASQFSDATQWNVGAFYEAQASSHLHVRTSAGYSVYAPDSGGASGSTGQFSGLYADLGITHKVNRLLNYTLSGGRTINFAYYGGTIDLYFARMSADWHLLRKTSIATMFEYDHGSQISSGGETFDRFGAGLTLGRMLTDKVGSSVKYQFLWRSSDQAGREYTANILTLNLTYTF